MNLSFISESLGTVLFDSIKLCPLNDVAINAGQSRQTPDGKAPRLQLVKNCIAPTFFKVLQRKRVLPFEPAQFFSCCLPRSCTQPHILTIHLQHLLASVVSIRIRQFVEIHLSGVFFDHICQEIRQTTPFIMLP